MIAQFYQFRSLVDTQPYLVQITQYKQIKHLVQITIQVQKFDFAGFLVVLCNLTTRGEYVYVCQLVYSINVSTNSEIYLDFKPDSLSLSACLNWAMIATCIIASLPLFGKNLYMYWHAFRACQECRGREKGSPLVLCTCSNCLVATCTPLLLPCTWRLYASASLS